MNFIFHNISGNFIIPIDERIFFKMVKNHQPDDMWDAVSCNRGIK